MTNSSPSRLRLHEHTLRTPRLTLRPMTEDDWPTLLSWNQDPRVLLTWNAGDLRPWTLEMLQSIYRNLSQKAWMFVAEEGARPLAECWIQEMNLAEVLSAHPHERLYRIDLSIGAPERWGQGLGTEIVHALVELGFEGLKADRLFACDVEDANPRSRRIFEKAGFLDWPEASTPPHPPRRRTSRHLYLTRARWGALSEGAATEREPR
jgi:RimJ/RimL family protein N-acetyltransferase